MPALMVSRDFFGGTVTDTDSDTGRGIDTEDRIRDLLHGQDRFHEIHFSVDSLKFFVSSVHGALVYVGPWHVHPPDLANGYAARGVAHPGARWNSYMPDLLRVEYLNQVYRIQIVEIKAHSETAEKTPPNRGLVLLNDDFQCTSYRYFLRRALLNAKAKRILRNVELDNNAAIWRSTSCYSGTCQRSECFLNAASREPSWKVTSAAALYFRSHLQTSLYAKRRSLTKSHGPRSSSHSGTHLCQPPCTETSGADSVVYYTGDECGLSRP
ncbi:hypothetical protein JCM11641_005829 [Rhodosporidiobolus odoratus]